VSVDTKRIRRYRKQSIHLLQSAIDQMRSGRWARSEELLWGSLTLAVKGVALSQGKQLDGEAQVREYAAQLGQERRDRRIRDAFSQLAKFADSVERIGESRFRVDRLVPVIEDVSSAVERLWEMTPVTDVADEGQQNETTK
jgi:hypothetical protein